MSRRKNLQTLRGMNNEPRRVQVRAAFSFALRLFLYTCYLSFSMKIISSVFLIYLIATQTNTHFLFASISNIYPPPPTPPTHTYTRTYVCPKKVLRDGAWRAVSARELVPGDVGMSSYPCTSSINDRSAGRSSIFFYRIDSMRNAYIHEQFHISSCLQPYMHIFYIHKSPTH